MTQFFLATALFLILAGTLIWNFEAIVNYAGYRGEDLTLKAGLAKWAGSNIVLLGVLILLLIGIHRLFPQLSPWVLAGGSFLIIVVVGIRIAIGSRYN